MKLICLRHGESEYNRLRLCNGDPGVPVALTETGRQQARTARDQLRERPIRRVYVSRLRRAQETAAIVNASHCAEIHVDARLDDRATGYEGRPVRAYLSAMAAAPDPFTWRAPGGESYLAMVARVHDFLAGLSCADVPAALLVSHHEVLQAVTGYFLRLAPERMWQIPIDHCQPLVFELRRP